MRQPLRPFIAALFAIALAVPIHALTFATLTSATQSQPPLPFDVIQFAAPRGPQVFTVGQRIAIPLCAVSQGFVQNLTAPRGARADAGNCGWTNMPAATTNPSGGNPPYHFKLDTMGGFPPFGVTLHPNTGFIEGVAKWPGTRTFQACAVDASENWACVPVTITINPKDAKRADPSGAALDATAAPCAALPQATADLQSVVSEVPDAEQRADALLKEARAGKLAAQTELFSAFRSGLELFLQSQVKATADMTRAYTALPGQVQRSPEAAAWMRRLDQLKEQRDALERLSKLSKSIESLPALLAGVQANTTNWTAFANFLHDSGLGDEASVQLASKLGSAKAVQMALKGIVVARDATFAELARRNSVQDMENAQRAINGLRAAGRDGANQAGQLSGPVADDCARFDQLRQTPRFNERPGQPTTSGKKPASGAKVLGGLVVAGAAGLGTYYYLDKTLKDLNTIDSGSGGSGGGSGGSSSSAFAGTYSAQVTYSCTTSAGAAEPCNRSFGSNGCAFESFTFSVSSGGTLNDACGWLTSALVGSSGTYSGRYTGTASRNMPISGTLPPSGSSLSGSDVYRGNTYRITIQLSKR